MSQSTKLSERLKTKAVNREGFPHYVVELYLDGKKIAEQTGMDYAVWIVEDHIVQYGYMGFRVRGLDLSNAEGSGNDGEPMP